MPNDDDDLLTLATFYSSPFTYPIPPPKQLSPPSCLLPIPLREHALPARRPSTAALSPRRSRPFFGSNSSLYLLASLSLTTESASCWPLALDLATREGVGGRGEEKRGSQRSPGQECGRCGAPGIVNGALVWEFVYGCLLSNAATITVSVFLFLLWLYFISYLCVCVCEEGREKEIERDKECRTLKHFLEITSQINTSASIHTHSFTYIKTLFNLNIFSSKTKPVLRPRAHSPSPTAQKSFNTDLGRFALDLPAINM